MSRVAKVGIWIAAIIVTIACILLLTNKQGDGVDVRTKKSSTAASAKNMLTGHVSHVSTQTTGKGTTNGSSSAQQAGPPTAGPCATVLTVAEVKSALNSNTITVAKNNGIMSQNSNTTIVTCAYSSGSNNMSIVAHLARSSIGQSDNAVSFGSGRPQGVTNVNGFGDNAYWQTSTGLNILKRNIWYVVRYEKQGTVTLSNSEKLATFAKL